MGSYARFEHYLTTLEVETCPEFLPPSPVSGPLCSVRGVRERQTREGAPFGSSAATIPQPLSRPTATNNLYSAAAAMAERSGARHAACRHSIVRPGELGAGQKTVAGHQT